MGACGGGGSTTSYRLDSNWEIVIYMDDRSGKLMQAKLEDSLAKVWVAPPSSFTGIWTTYYVNGMKSDVISYRKGIYFGEFISYRSDGSKCVVQHYDEGGCDGDDTGYFPSGKTMYRAHYKNNVPVGIWNWYREDGTIVSSQDHTK
jgi:antitoxin component YwqK of YwqJK toxin-antitoxin module